MDNLYLKELNLVNFKSYTNLNIELSPKLNCFVGDNGVGKTNLFDSIYYLSFCKSFFHNQDVAHIHHGKLFFSIRGKFQIADREDQILCSVKKDQKKRFVRNDKTYQRLADHIGLIPLVMVSPSDSTLILDGSEERRKYMNGVIAQYDRQYLDDIIHYGKAVQQRNRLLKDFAKNHSFDEEMLAVWDHKMVDLGNRIFSARKRFIQDLVPVFQHYYQIISGGEEQVHLEYQSHLASGDFTDLLRDAREKDRAVQYSTTGVHRDDLKLLLAGHPIKYQGSQGQQKSFLVALKLAQYDFLKEIGSVHPLILFDDLFDKLDEKRVTKLVQLVADDHFGQIFITDKNLDHLKKILTGIPVSARVFVISGGEAVITLTGNV
ncbi:MAG: DNA replication and repair protein RecF [Bacteroidales bacterium]|nr:DNA replication and repair protein RecF [Bacteroidales bacterium]